MSLSRGRFGPERSARAWAPFLALLLGGVISCTGGGLQEPRACTEEARASVMVSVVNAAGAPLPGARVTWRANGGETQSAECADFSLPPSGCARFVAGWEVSGLIEIRAEKAAFHPDSTAVTVPMDEFGCHVVTREATLTMLALAGAGR